VYRIFFVLSLTLLSAAILKAQPTNAIDETRFPAEHRQFDFWIGEWDVNLRRIQDDQSWVDWKTAIARIHPILDGKAVLELWVDQHEGPPGQVIIGYSLRYYHPETGKWHLWLNWPGPERSGSIHLEGQFRHGRGEFFGKRSTSDSTSIISRYTFSDITGNSLRWDDAFSRDGGESWTHNWVMEFSRRSDKAPWDNDQDYALHTYRNGERCTKPPFKELQNFTGNWEGELNYLNGNGQWETTGAELNSYKLLGGCAVISFLYYELSQGMFREFSLKTYNTYVNSFEDGRLDNDPDTHYRPMFGEKSGNTFELSRVDRETGETQEKYIWEPAMGTTLKLEKWELRNGELTRTLTGEFEKR